MKLLHLSRGDESVPSARKEEDRELGRDMREGEGRVPPFSQEEREKELG